jgi:hypothetical protein
MAKVIATEAAVHAALDQLDSRGEKPSQRGVIQILGGGSFSTVTKHCQTWQPKQSPAVALGPVPDSVLLQARQLAEDLWTLSAVEAEKHANARLVTAELKLKRSEENREELAGILDQLTPECDALRTRASEANEWKARCASLRAERDALHRIVDHISGRPSKNRRPKEKRTGSKSPEGATPVLVE